LTTPSRRAAELFAPVHAHRDGVDGWVSLEVSPLLVHDTPATITQAKVLHAKAARPNVFIKIPGTPEGLPAIEECTFAGIPINVTLLFSAEQYVASAEAYLRGVERRVHAGRTRQSPRWARCSSAAGTPQSPTGFPTSFGTGSVSPKRRWPTGPTETCSTRPGGDAWSTKGPGATAAVGQHLNKEPRRA
jgi:hypothetical protein